MREAVFVLDTNVLLNLYRYSPQTRDDYFNLIAVLGDRLHIPWEVAKEFFEARVGLILERNSLRSTLQEDLEGIHNKAKGSIEPLKRHAPIDIQGLLASIEAAFAQATREISELPAPVNPMDDPVLNRLAALLDGKIRPEPTLEEIGESEKWAEARYKKNIPPGFKDSDKDGAKKYGDAKIWRDILAIGRDLEKPVIFVTDDLKEDWWLVPKRGQSLGPHPALRHEFRLETGREFYMYPADRFLSIAGSNFNAEVGTESVSEATEVRDQLNIEPWRKNLENVQRERDLTASHLNDARHKYAYLREMYGPAATNQEALNALKLASRSVELQQHRMNALNAIISKTYPDELHRRFEQLDGNGNVRVQRYAPNEDSANAFLIPAEVEILPLSPDEIEQLMNAKGPAWLERLGGYYEISKNFLVGLPEREEN